jgi:GT2 family glycosyltransferase
MMPSRFLGGKWGLYILANERSYELESGEKTFIIILNWNGKHDTIECLHSLATVKGSHIETVVVDNGSTDGSAATIRELFPHVTVLETGSNLGYAEGNNVGIRYALKHGGCDVLLLNNDTVVDPDILESFRKAMQDHPAAGILGGKILLYSERDTFDHFGGKWNKKKGQFDLVGFRQIDDGQSWEEIQPIDYACGCVLFIRREVFEKVGLLEPDFFLIWEEADFCFRTRKAGYGVMICPQAKLWHKVSASFVGGKPHSTYFWWRNRLLWIERNCSLWERCSLFLRVVIPDVLHLYKLKILKTIQLKLLTFFRPQDDHKKRKERILKYTAALQGVRDYLRRKFGNGPEWIYTKKN